MSIHKIDVNLVEFLRSSAYVLEMWRRKGKQALNDVGSINKVDTDLGF